MVNIINAILSQIRSSETRKEYLLPYNNKSLVITSKPVYAEIPTYDGSGLAAHVNICYIPSGLEGYKYWAVMTPYPNNDDSFENPSIVVSNNLSTWVVPVGLTNPIVTPPVDGSHYSDVSIVFTGTTLLVYYRWTSSDGLTNKIYLKTSSNGVTWSAATECIFTNLIGGNAVSPQAVLTSAGVDLYCINGTTRRIEKYKSTDGVNFTLNNYIRTPNIAGTAWHLTMQPDERGYHFIVSFNDRDILRNKIYYGFSPDGNMVAWDTEPLLYSEINTDWEKSTYVGCIVPYTNKWKCFFTPVGANNSGDGTYVCDVEFTGYKNKLTGQYPVGIGLAIRNTNSATVDITPAMKNYRTKTIHVINGLDADVVVAIYCGITGTAISHVITCEQGAQKVITGAFSDLDSVPMLDKLTPEGFTYNLLYAATSAPTSGSLSIIINCEE